ncbi:L,D-transpeptidase [Streptomyces boluensis]|uniref:L,D-transpeptidase family protein n=1 Tax=Streptomyces boluensis TaxID=1775135 RepID=A0A964XL66_9ACTN|nr:Ig-like domain-containing protein [Streptomyces boluensis]NBE53124.1 L,D-transpeptidase family protein [Streptomyces boluensis]
MLRTDSEQQWRACVRARAKAYGIGSAAAGVLLITAAAPGTETAVDAAATRARAAAALDVRVGHTLDRPGGTGLCPVLAGPRASCPGTAGVPADAPLHLVPDDGTAPRERDVRRVKSLVDPGGSLDVTLGSPGLLLDVAVTDSRGRRVAGRLGPGGRQWERTAPLRADDHYTVRVAAELPDGSPVRGTLRLDTAPQRSGRTLTAHFSPASGTYGVGQPVTAHLTRPVPRTDPAARGVVERSLRVTTTPAVAGAWHWVDSSTLHYRPRAYWPAHTRIAVRSGLDGVRVNDQLVGGSSKPAELTIGDRVEAVTDVDAHEMTVLRNGRVLRTIPVTTGKAGFRTRGGIKVVLGKERLVRMRGDSIGIARGSGDWFDLPVHYATRLTWSGEYVHAAPWSVADQGSSNVSHGCTGMTTENAAWFYRTVKVGDLVEVVNSHGDDMTPFDNGYGDWNVGWKTWRDGSALATAATGSNGTGSNVTGERQPDTERLDPSI